MPPEIASEYTQFLSSKRRVSQGKGFSVDMETLAPAMHDWQRLLTAWSLSKGRAALFEDTGLGKTLQQLEWARIICLLNGGDVLILTTLGVAKQTVREGIKFDIPVNLCRSQDDVKPGINITNYDRLHLFDLYKFVAVVLDESSILKNFEGKTRNSLIASCQSIPYRLCCTATPAPNDITEIANHVEFLGIMTRTEMLAEFFYHDDEGWHLRPHAETAFYRFLATLSAWVKRPSDIGYSDEGYILPALSILPQYVDSDYRPSGSLLTDGVRGVTDRAAVRKATVKVRSEKVAQIVTVETHQPWVIWCGLNEEAERVTDALKVYGAVNVHGSLKPDIKEGALEDFAAGNIPILVTKPKVAGFGLNWQHASRMAFVGLSDSYESYYQCIRREWRYGQAKPVTAHVVLSELESAIYENILKKEQEAVSTNSRLLQYMRELGRDAYTLDTSGDEQAYEHSRPMSLPHWLGVPACA